MAISEFELIRRYFQQPGLAADPQRHAHVGLGIGDDCALLEVPPDQQLAISLDVLVSDVHFPANADPAAIAQRALAVNLSDLAAMGAAPVGFTLGLTLPAAELAWLEAFSNGLRESAERYACPLLGGDTTRGPLQIAIQVQGLVPRGTALRRSGARAGDDVYVSGALGRAGLALAVFKEQLPGAAPSQVSDLLQAYYRPEPRLALGQALRGIATAAQDVSDGLLADLGHIAAQSNVHIDVQAASVPVAKTLQQLLPAHEALRLAATAGDDYELVFTAPLAARAAVQSIAATLDLPLARIGSVRAGEGVQLVDVDGAPIEWPQRGYDHFQGES